MEREDTSIPTSSPFESSSQVQRASGKRNCQGHLVFLSHVLYLTGAKCFLISVEEEEESSSGRTTVTILVPIYLESFRPLQTVNKRFLGCSVLVTRIFPLKSREFGGKLGLHRATARSSLRILSSAAAAVPRQVSSPECYFEGVVTFAGDAGSGVVVLNKRVLLVATAICHLTNVRRLSMGQKVFASGMHLERGGGRVDYYALENPKAILGMCAASFLRPDTEGDFASPHCKRESEDFGRDSVVDATLRRNYGFRTILSLVSIRRQVISLFEEKVVEESLTRKDGPKNHLLELCDHLFGPTPPASLGRCLIEECCDVKHLKCHVVNAPTASRRKRLCSLKDSKLEISSWLQGQKWEVDAHGGDDQVKWSKIEVGASDGDLVLFGKVAADLQSGCLQLRDSTGSINLCLTSKDAVRAVNSYALVDGFGAYLEWYRQETIQWERLYVVPKRIHPLFQGQREEKCSEDGDDVLRVLSCSGPLIAKKGARVSVLACRQQVAAEHNFERAKTLTFDVSDLAGHATVLPGAKLRTSGQDGSSVVLVREAFNSEMANLFRISEVSEAPGDGTSFSVEGEVVGRWIERRNKCEGSQHKVPAMTEGFLPHRVTCHLKLRDHRDATHLASFYLFRERGFLFPLGLITGDGIRLENVRKVISAKGNPYLMPTPMTNVVYIGKNYSTTSPKGTKEAYLYWLPNSFQGVREAHWYHFALEKVVKVSVRLLCPSCSCRLGSRGQCEFPGCHAGTVVASQEAGPQQGSEDRCQEGLRAVTSCNALLRVADETGEAQLVVQDVHDLRQILRFSRSEWNLLLSSSHSSGAEVLFLCRDEDGGKDSNSVVTEDFSSSVVSLFKLRCELLTDCCHVPLKVLARPFKEDRSSSGFLTSGSASSSLRRLYCLQVEWKKQEEV